MKCISTTARTEPEYIAIDKLSGDWFNIKIAENIVSTAVTRSVRDEETGERTTEETAGFAYDMYMGTFKATSYDEFIAGAIHTRYSLDDEAALINKAIADASNAEYAAYRVFVADVKTRAAEYFENN